jgi:hypothetical protein
VSIVTAAVVNPKRRSSLGSASFFRPNRTSRIPNSLRDRAAHVAGDLREGRDPLLERRVIHEQLGGG